MVVAGKVQNGGGVLENGATLPEGQELKVIASEPSGQGTHSLLDVPTVSLGEMLVPYDCSEVFDEMLEHRFPIPRANDSDV